MTLRLSQTLRRIATGLGLSFPIWIPDTARADDADQRFDPPPQVFLERSYIVWGAPPTGPEGKDPWLLFEAGVAPHFFLYEDLSDRLRSGVSGFAIAVPFTFETILRMFAVASSPVRMPSYMP